MSSRAAIDAAAAAAWLAMDRAPGLMTEREGKFLTFALAACPVRGAIVEIGSFKGKSTVGLATVAKRLGLGRVTAIDPHTSPSITDPDLRGASSTFDEFTHTLRAADVEDHVDVRRAFSADVARTWNAPIAFLWIDGDHTLEGVRLDFDGFSPFLVDGAIVAFHDTLNPVFAGPIRVFSERVLRGANFGAAGFCGSIGWAQVRASGSAASSVSARARLALARKADRVARDAVDGDALHGLRKIRFKLARARIPHDAPAFETWFQATRLERSGGV